MTNKGRTKAVNGGATERLKISITSTQKMQLEEVAARHSVSIAEVIRQVLDAWLAKQGAPKAAP